MFNFRTLDVGRRRVARARERRESLLRAGTARHLMAAADKKGARHRAATSGPKATRRSRFRSHSLQGPLTGDWEGSLASSLKVFKLSALFGGEGGLSRLLRTWESIFPFPRLSLVSLLALTFRTPRVARHSRFPHPTYWSRAPERGRRKRALPPRGGFRTRPTCMNKGLTLLLLPTRTYSTSAALKH